MFLLRLRRCTLAPIPPSLQAAALFKHTFFFAWDTPGTSIFHTTNNWISLNLRSTTGIIPLVKTARRREIYGSGTDTGPVATGVFYWSLIFRCSTVEALLTLHLHTLCIYGGAAKKTSSEDQYCEKRRNISTPLEKIEEGGGWSAAEGSSLAIKIHQRNAGKWEKSDEPAHNLMGLKPPTLSVRVCRINQSIRSPNFLQVVPLTQCPYSTNASLIPFPFPFHFPHRPHEPPAERRRCWEIVALGRAHVQAGVFLC